MKMFSHPQCLMRLARFTLEAHCSVVSGTSLCTLHEGSGLLVEYGTAKQGVLGLIPTFVVSLSKTVEASHSSG